MAEFEPHHLQPLHATCGFHRGPCDRASIRVPLRPFVLDDETVDTALRLDQIEFDTDDFNRLAQRAFSFPLNPGDGAVDGSVYIRSRHHPVDVRRIEFGTIADEAMPLRLEGAVEYELFHTGERTVIAFDLQTRLLLPASAATIQTLVERAIAQCSARGRKDMGRVMQVLRPQVMYPDQLGAFAEAVKSRLAAG